MRYTKHINRNDKYFKSINKRKTDSSNILYFLVFATFIFSIVILSLFYFINNSNYFKINKDTIIINKNGFLIDESQLKQYIHSELEGELLFSVHFNDIYNRVTNKYKVIKNIEIFKKYPNTLTINIIERKPIFAIYNEDENNSFMVSEDGYIIGKTNKSNEYLFKVNYIDEIVEGSYIDNNLFEIYNDIVRQVDKVNLKIENITFTKENSVVYLGNNIKVLLSNKKVIENSFFIVDSIIKSQSKDKQVNIIDLRFDKVVVSYL